ncbi:hypothetical protein PanWU01x14_262230 [Parasponia andersonii]|uniref:Uncharacterized protein n=1 Tax=Parasponia andersonii TaxID=3476 RepID=A0A2P5B8F0_PARAD|nr:hypothetical protein PanWU01x14_262230 [Parasponia andersonii]
MSRIHSQTLIANQHGWLNSSSVTYSHGLEESVGTKVLIPLPGGLIELFVN